MRTQKVRLDQSIAQIGEIGMRWNNGDTTARILLNQENVLWPVAGSLNNV